MPALLRAREQGRPAGVLDQMPRLDSAQSLVLTAIQETGHEPLQLKAWAEENGVDADLIVPVGQYAIAEAGKHRIKKQKAAMQRKRAKR